MTLNIKKNSSSRSRGSKPSCLKEGTHVRGPYGRGKEGKKSGTLVFSGLFQECREAVSSKEGIIRMGIFRQEHGQVGRLADRQAGRQGSVTLPARVNQRLDGWMDGWIDAASFFFRYYAPGLPELPGVGICAQRLDRCYAQTGTTEGLTAN